MFKWMRCSNNHLHSSVMRRRKMLRKWWTVTTTLNCSRKESKCTSTKEWVKCKGRRCSRSEIKKFRIKIYLLRMWSQMWQLINWSHYLVNLETFPVVFCRFQLRRILNIRMWRLSLVTSVIRMVTWLPKQSVNIRVILQ